MNIESIPQQRLHLVCNLTGNQTHTQISCTRWTVEGETSNEQQWLLALCRVALNHMMVLLDTMIQTLVAIFVIFSSNGRWGSHEILLV